MTHQTLHNYTFALLGKIRLKQQGRFSKEKEISIEFLRFRQTELTLLYPGIEILKQSVKTTFFTPKSLEVVGAARFESRNTTPTFAEDITLQVMIKEDRSRLGYRGDDQGGSTSLAKEEAVLGQFFVRESIAMIGGEPTCRMGWVYATEEELTNWRVETLKSNQISPTGNQTLKNEEPDQPSEPNEGASTEVEAPANIEQWIDKEKPKFEALTEDLESINLGKGIEGREVRIGKQVPLDLSVKLVELLKEYANIFA
ncbi:hypothetical protein CR513_08641, partial [Mucuna pruriens]